MNLIMTMRHTDNSQTAEIEAFIASGTARLSDGAYNKNPVMAISRALTVRQKRPC